MAEKKVAKKKSREVLIDPMTRDSRAPLSETLDRVRKYVEKTEFEPVDGVNADALDVAEGRGVLSGLINRIRASRLPTVPSGPAPTIPLRPPATVTLPKNIPTPQVSNMARLGKFLGPVAKKLPGANVGVVAYETASLINSPEARKKARDQSEEMYKRGDGSIEADLKNIAQGVLDPVGTIYAANNALGETMETYGGLAYDKLFGPSEEEQIAAARYRGSKRRDRLRLERMSPEQKAVYERKSARMEADRKWNEEQTKKRFGNSVNAREEKKNPLTDEQYRLSIPRSRGPYPKS
jgi:hypothetical protein